MDALEANPNDVPAETPPDIAGSPEPPVDDISELLAQFDEANNNQGGQQAPVQDDPIANLFRDPADERRIGELTGELDGLRGQMHQKAEMEAFEKYSAQLQSKLDGVPDSFARDALLSAAAQDPNLAAAWQYRGITEAQRRQADAEFRQLEQLHAQVLRAPDDDRKSAALRQIEQAGKNLGLMMNSQQILRRLERDIVKRASEFKPIDQEATADHFAVAQAVRDAGAPRGVDPPPKLGSLTDNELREYTRKNFGFV